MSRETLLAQTMVELADTLVDEFDVVDLLSLLSDRCVEIFDVAAAGIMLAEPDGTLQVMASSSPAMRLAEMYELQAHEGPCLDCYNSGEPVNNGDLEDQRWPRFSVVAMELGFRSAHALPLRLRGTTVGGLNLFRDEPGELSPADLTVAQAFADVATIAILQHRKVLEAHVLNEQLQGALESRVVIEQAKGTISALAALTVDEAFAALRNYARNNNVRLTDVAHEVINGNIPAALVR